MFKYIREWFTSMTVNDLAQHRTYTTRYEDLCM